MKKTAKLYREKTVKELNKEIMVLKEEIARLNLSEKSVRSKDTNLIFKKRKQLAVLLTVLSEKKQIEKI